MSLLQHNMAQEKQFRLMLGLLLALTQLTAAAPQPEAITQFKGRDSIPPPPVITDGGYHYVPELYHRIPGSANADSFTTPPPPPVIQTIYRRQIHDSASANDVFTIPPPPDIQNGGFHYAPTPTSHPDGELFSLPPAPDIVTIQNRDPVTITQMSQLITSQVPVTTICPLPSPLPSSLQPPGTGFPTASNNSSSPPYTSSGILHPRQLIVSRPVPPIKPAPVSTYAPNVTCSISYSPTVIPICRITLSPLAAPVIPITACDQSRHIQL